MPNTCRTWENRLLPKGATSSCNFPQERSSSCNPRSPKVAYDTPQRTYDAPCLHARVPARVGSTHRRSAGETSRTLRSRPCPNRRSNPVEGGSCNDYDYVCADPVNGLDLAGTNKREVGLNPLRWGGNAAACVSDVARMWSTTPTVRTTPTTRSCVQPVRLINRRERSSIH
jgi:hypothetical protein